MRYCMWAWMERAINKPLEKLHTIKGLHHTQVAQQV